jgi:bifunctional UDP-N-acetylglucosamine pyrophosphorylase / glucosamine-1-phosphate N-acetyltransferase
MLKLAAIVLAAGQGTRMKSPVPKMLHPLAGRPLIHYAVRAVLDAGASDVVVVVGHGGGQVQTYLADTFGGAVRTAEQSEQRGTGHAALMAMPLLGDVESTLVLYGDAPLVEVRDLRALAAALEGHPEAPLALLTCVLDDPTGYGRVLRDGNGRVLGIREHRDLRNEKERAISEVNPGFYAARLTFLREALGELQPTNEQKELYLTDIVEAAGKKGGAIALPTEPASLVGVNDRAQLGAAEASMHRRIVERLGRAGVTFRGDPRVDDLVEVEPNATLESGVVLRGKTTVRSGAIVDVGCVLSDAIVEEGAHVLPYSVVTSSRIGPRAKVGPFAHLRPGSEIGEEAHIGNFVETKKTLVRARAKANHLAYLGDGDLGEDSNIGAGTIFCNYDGAAKHKTVVGRGAFVGSDSQLVAPVTIGDGAYVATGTTVTSDVPADALAIGRVKQQNKPNYASKLKTKLAGRAQRGK